MTSETLEIRARERAELFETIAIDIISSDVIPSASVVLRRPRLHLASRAYFVLSERYKAARIQTGHNTEKPKIAALSAIAIMTIQPFRPIDPDNVSSLAVAKCNEIFAATVAMSTIDKEIVQNSHEGRDFWLRLLDVLSGLKSETLEPLIVDASMDITDKRISQYAEDIHANDWFQINALICMMELLAHKFSAN